MERFADKQESPDKNCFRRLKLGLKHIMWTEIRCFPSLCMSHWCVCSLWRQLVMTVFVGNLLPKVCCNYLIFRKCQIYAALVNWDPRRCRTAILRSSRGVFSVCTSCGSYFLSVSSLMANTREQGGGYLTGQVFFLSFCSLPMFLLCGLKWENSSPSRTEE